MYICHECLGTFTEPDGYEEHHPYGMGYASEGFDCCPYCGSRNFDDAKRCDRCDEWVVETNDGLCDVCYEDMYGKQEE